MPYASRAVKSKWTKTGWLVREADTRGYVPETRLFTRPNLAYMLGRYGTLYFKPTNGTGGQRIMRIKRFSASQPNRFQIRFNSVTRQCRNEDQLYRSLKSFAGRRSYLLQKGIDLAKSGKRPFDLRIMVQKTNQKKWVVSAIFAKIGKPGKVVTNYHQGGRLATLGQTLKASGMNGDLQKQMTGRLHTLGKRVSACFDKRKGFRELGIDVAIDTNRRLWILEVNTKPQFYPLNKWKDKSMYRKVMRYARQYGRRNGASG